MRDEKVREHCQRKEYSHVGKRTTQVSRGQDVCAEKAVGAVAATLCWLCGRGGHFRGWKRRRLPIPACSQRVFSGIRGRVFFESQTAAFSSAGMWRSCPSDVCHVRRPGWVGSWLWFALLTVRRERLALSCFFIGWKSVVNIKCFGHMSQISLCNCTQDPKLMTEN